jgi:hypothetical protein
MNFRKFEFIWIDSNYFLENGQVPLFLLGPNWPSQYGLGWKPEGKIGEGRLHGGGEWCRWDSGEPVMRGGGGPGQGAPQWRGEHDCGKKGLGSHRSNAVRVEVARGGSVEGRRPRRRGTMAIGCGWRVLERHGVTPGFKAKTRCSSYVCPGSSCNTYNQNVNAENQCLYYINIITWNIVFT